jgi:hypothetical protein
MIFPRLLTTKQCSHRRLTLAFTLNPRICVAAAPNACICVFIDVGTVDFKLENDKLNVADVAEVIVREIVPFARLFTHRASDVHGNGILISFMMRWFDLHSSDASGVKITIDRLDRNKGILNHLFPLSVVNPTAASASSRVNAPSSNSFNLTSQPRNTSQVHTFACALSMLCVVSMKCRR